MPSRAVALRRPSPPTLTRREWAARICATWQHSVESIIETGRCLVAAKAQLEHGRFGAMVESDLPFGARTAEMLIAVAEDPRIAKANHGSYLPPSWRTMYELTRLDDAAFAARLKDGTINPEMERSDILGDLTEARRMERLAEMRDLTDNPLRLPQGPFAAGIADPPWLDPDAPIGHSPRHYRSKYPTMSPAEIAALPVGDIFGPKAFLALWITRHMLAIGAHVEVLAAWGFEPRTITTWDKQWNGLGNGFVRDTTEHIVFACRGKVAAPTNPRHRPNSLFSERRTNIHSQKPLWMHKQIERWFPDMSYVELFARTGKGESVRKGWVAWGHEAANGA